MAGHPSHDGAEDPGAPGHAGPEHGAQGPHRHRPPRDTGRGSQPGYLAGVGAVTLAWLRHQF